MSSPYLTGIDGTALLTTPSSAAKELAVVEWNLQMTAEVQNFINSLTGHFAVNAATFISTRFSITVDVDPTNEIFSVAVGAYVGETIGPVKLYRQKSGTLGFHFVTAVIESMTERMERRGKLVQTLNCIGNGAPLHGDGTTAIFPAEASWPVP